MKDLFNLIPPGWTFEIYHNAKYDIFKITMYDNIGAGNSVAVSAECVNDVNEAVTKESLITAIKQLNKLYGL